MEKNKNKVTASMTVEAVMVLPLFLFTILTLYSAFEMFHFYGGLESELSKEVQKVAVYSAAKDILSGDLSGQQSLEGQGEDGSGIHVQNLAEKFLANAYVENSIKKKIDEEALKRAGVGGYGSLHYEFPILSSEATVLDVAVVYEMKPLFNFLFLDGFQVVNRARVKKWTGYDADYTGEEEERYVYITDTGTVYHLSETCTHLDLSIVPVDREELRRVRTANGSVFRACEICGRGSDNTIYITDTGDCYHSSLSCSGLRRSVQRVPLSQCEGMNCCSRCAGTAP